MLKKLFILPIRFYRKFISPNKPPCCRFSPTCSQYAIEAITEWGVVVGLALALWRILRCNPFCKGGHDPVPVNRRRRARLEKRKRKKEEKERKKAGVVGKQDSDGSPSDESVSDVSVSDIPASDKPVRDVPAKDPTGSGGALPVTDRPPRESDRFRKGDANPMGHASHGKDKDPGTDTIGN